MLGDLGRRLIKKRRLITETNIRRALPGQDYKKISRECYRHFGNNLLEFLLLPFHKTIFNKWLRFKNPEKFHKALENGKGAILLTAHFGNWEILSCLSRFELTIYGLYQKLKHGDSVIRMLREYTGAQLIEKQSALKEGIKALRNNNILGMVADQGQGRKAKFFNLETSFPEGPARIALQTGAAILPTFCIRRGNFLDIEILDEIIIPENLSKEETINKITAEFAKILEKMIKQEPAQYFWMHDLWRLFKNDKTDL
jgi:KDO2-lipid IV(A) lauroyltransferase